MHMGMMLMRQNRRGKNEKREDGDEFHAEIPLEKRHCRRNGNGRLNNN
jgi:hypothetical protein